MAAKPVKGLSAGQSAYWEKKMPGADRRAILLARSRQMQRHNPQAFGPNTNLSPVQADQQAGAAAGLRYDPAIAQVRSQIGQLDPAFAQYKQQLAQAQAQSQAATTAAVGDITSRGQQTAASSQAQVDQIRQQMTADAAKRGASVDPSLFTNAQQGIATQGQAQNAFAATAQNLGTAQQNYLTQRGDVAQGLSAAQRQKLQGQVTDLLGQKGDYTNVQKQQLIKDARTYGIELGTLGVSQQNAKTAGQVANVNASDKAANLKLKKLQLSAGLTKQQHDMMLADQKFKLDQQKYGSAQAKDNYQRLHKLGSYKPGGAKAGASPYSAGERSSSRKQISQVNNAVGQIKTLLSQTGHNTHKVRTVMELPKGAKNPYGGWDRDIVNAAFDLVTFGHLSPQNYKTLKQAGVLIPKQWAPKGTR